MKKPSNPNFASGPVRKFTGWDTSWIDFDMLGRSHRSAEASAIMGRVSSKVKALFHIPDEYVVLFVPAGTTGSFEMAAWNLIGCRPVDFLVFDFFGKRWHDDIKNNLKVPHVNLYESSFGYYPDTSEVNFQQHDVVFTYSGTTTGTVFKDMDKIPTKREGLIFSDITSYSGYDINWNKIDVACFSWQKLIAGEAAHGMMVLSPNAIKRLQDYTPKWPIPKLFAMKNGSDIKEADIFNIGFLMNTPSILCFLEVEYNLDYFLKKGGSIFINNRVEENYQIMKRFINKTPWIDFFVKEESFRSKSVVCLELTETKITSLDLNQKKEINSYLLNLLSCEKVAFDIGFHHSMKYSTGFRIWLGPTIETEDVKILTEWLSFAYLQTLKKFGI